MTTSPNLQQPDEDDLRSVVAKSARIPQEVDEGSRKEEDFWIDHAENLGGLNPLSQLQYHYREQARKLDIRIETLEKELNRLKPIEIEHARLSQSKRKTFKMSFVSVIAIAAGGAMISSFANETDVGLFSFGWGLLVLGLVHQVFNTVFD